MFHRQGINDFNDIHDLPPPVLHFDSESFFVVCFLDNLLNFCLPLSWLLTMSFISYISSIICSIKFLVGRWPSSCALYYSFIIASCDVLCFLISWIYLSSDLVCWNILTALTLLVCCKIYTGWFNSRSSSSLHSFTPFKILFLLLFIKT